MVIALVVGLAGWQTAKRPDGPRTEIKAVDGTLSLSNSRDGSAVLSVSNLAPGESASGIVVLGNTGTLSGALDLSQTDLTDTVGRAGGQLSQALLLTVRDVVRGEQVYSGPLSDFDKRDLGTMVPGETRTYSFDVILPDTGVPASAVAGDNAFAGSSVSANYTWGLGDASGGGGDGGGGGNAGGGSGGAGSGAGGSGPGGGAGSGGLVSKMRVSLGVNAKTALKNGRIDVTVKCGEPCKVRSYAMLRKRKTMKTRRKSASVRVANKKVKIKLKLSTKGKANLAKTLSSKGKDYIVVYVTATDPRGGVVSLKKQVRVKRAKR
jgi:hypothetical protein